MASVKSLEHDVKEAETVLRELDGQLADLNNGLEQVPNDATLLELKEQVLEMHADAQKDLADKKASLDAIKPTSAAPKSQLPPQDEKWSKDKHPAFQPGYRRPGAPPSPPPPEPQAPVTFNVNDTVMAKWISGDKSFYQAKITSITGSSANPIYSVFFKDYGNTDNVRKADLKPIDPKKRKADPPSTPSTSASAATNPGVISAAANVNPALANQAKTEPSKVSDGPPRPPKIAKKVKANKELEAGKAKWQEFAAKKGKIGKTVKKDSMFRTGEGVNARVGFIGSGQAMRKDPTRSKHVYTAPEDD